MRKLPCALVGSSPEGCWSGRQDSDLQLAAKHLRRGLVALNLPDWTNGAQGKWTALQVAVTVCEFAKVATGYMDKIVCMPFFGEFDYDTAMNGPIWIMGTPLFYEYQVHYAWTSGLKRLVQI